MPAARRTAHHIGHLLREEAAAAAEYLRNNDAAVQAMRDGARPSHPLFLVLDNVRSAYNVGSIFRTADTAALAEVVTCGFTPHPPHPKLLKTAFGAVDSVPTRHVESTLSAIRSLQADGVAVYAMETTARSRNYAAVAFPREGAALVLGNEEIGVDTRLAAVDGIRDPDIWGQELARRGAAPSLSTRCCGSGVLEASRRAEGGASLNRGTTLFEIARGRAAVHTACSRAIAVTSRGAPVSPWPPQRLGDALHAPRRRANFVGWHVSPLSSLSRDGAPSSVGAAPIGDDGAASGRQRTTQVLGVERRGGGGGCNGARRRLRKDESILRGWQGEGGDEGEEEEEEDDDDSDEAGERGRGRRCASTTPGTARRDGRRCATLRRRRPATTAADRGATCAAARTWRTSARTSAASSAFSAATRVARARASSSPAAASSSSAASSTSRR